MTRSGGRKRPGRYRRRGCAPGSGSCPRCGGVGVAVLLKIVYAPWFLNYDARYALLWARDLARGLTPDYEAPFAPTPHPLETLVSLVAVPFGTGGDAIMLWATLLCFGLLVWLAYRLGEELFSPWVGVVTALVVLTRPALERDALIGYRTPPSRS